MMSMLALDQVLRILGHFLPFWDFDSLSKVERKTKWRSWDLNPSFRDFWVLGYVMGMGMSTHGFTHV
jgi:hypothetical protein